MDSRVQELLEKIKRDAVDEANAKAAKIIADGEARRAELIAAAEKEAKAIVEKGKADAQRSEEAGKAALQQASRDLIRAFRSEIEKLLARLVQQDVQAAFDEDTLKKAIPLVLEAWAKDTAEDLSLMLPEAQLKSIDAWFKAGLAKTLARGVELKPLKSGQHGFRIAEKDGAAYYDFSAAAVADMLSAYLNDQLAAIVAQAAQ